MYLQRLEIQGFKSFARKTVFEFPMRSNHDEKANSITAIVGPNGSGKSNVSDAIRWVLGEQSLKLIRCKKSDDVIFGGSEKKARQGFSEVSIFFNNEDKELPIDYTEVVITRRVYRTGETEYLMNKKAVRLFDILILLAKANFGQRTYSIIGQGMVDHIINISPFERKNFFDEATGVKQHQIKRDQAVSRLKRSRENLDETNKILAELEPRLRLLAKQIKKLEKRKEIEQDLRSLQKNYYSFLWQNLKRDLTRFGHDFSLKEALKNDLEAQLNQIQTKLAASARQESRQEIFNQLQKEYSRLQTEKNSYFQELATVKGKMSVEYVKAGKQNLTWLENKKEELGKRANEITESLESTKSRLDYIRAEFLEKESDLETMKREISVLQNNLQSAELELARIKNGGRGNGSLDSVKAVLRQKEVISGIFGTVSELAHLEKMYEPALAVIAGNRLSAIVVQNDEVAIKCINYLKQYRLSPLTFFPLNKLRAFEPSSQAREILGETGAIGLAIDLLSFDSKFRKVFQLIFGGTIVVDNLDSAKKIGVGRERMVTLEGDVLEKYGTMKGGFRRQSSLSWLVFGNGNVLSTQEEKLKEITLLKSKIETANKNKENLFAEISELKVSLQVNDTKKKGLSNDLESLKKETDQILREIAENQLAPDEQDKYLKGLAERKNELENQITEIDLSVLEKKKKIDEFNLSEEKKKNEVFQLQAKMQEFQIQVNSAVSELNEIKVSLARLETKKEDLEKEIVQELGEINFNDLQSEERINVDQVWLEISKQKQQLELIGGIDEEVISEHKEVAERYEFLSTQVNDLEKAINDLEKIVVELDEIINKQFNASFKKINQAFGHYFVKIFGGGKAKLDLIQKEKAREEVEGEFSDDDEEKLMPEEKSKLVNTGIEIMAAPPNKKVENIAVLSGGERTMTSLALICAIIDSNPAPFIVMDEVDAALDEANSEKFAAILQELSYKSQFVVITHNKIIMHVADVLYGVAMGDDGVSRTLSLDLKEAETQAEN